MSDVGSFWARRRAAVKAEEQAELHAIEEAQVAAKAAELAEKDDAVILEEMGLPDPSAMKAGDDFTGFMSRDVPEHLRRQALRTLWRSNPVLACVDGLNDYDDDYRVALLQEPIKTAYQVGKGMTKHVEEMERQAAAAELKGQQQENGATDLAEAGPETEVVALVEKEAVSEDVVACDDIHEVAGPQEAEKDELEECAPAPRRMRFHFGEAAV